MRLEDVLKGERSRVLPPLSPAYPLLRSEHTCGSGHSSDGHNAGLLCSEDLPSLKEETDQARAKDIAKGGVIEELRTFFARNRPFPSIDTLPPPLDYPFPLCQHPHLIQCVHLLPPNTTQHTMRLHDHSISRGTLNSKYICGKFAGTVGCHVTNDNQERD